MDSEVLLHNLLFTVIFQGLAVWAACVFLAAVLPNLFGMRTFFKNIAKPATRAVAAVTPAILPSVLNPLLTIFWLLSLRVMFYLTMAAYGMLPKAGI